MKTIDLPKSPTFLGNFCKGVKNIIFMVKSLLSNFYGHLAIFFWSHWLLLKWVNMKFTFPDRPLHFGLKSLVITTMVASRLYANLAKRPMTCVIKLNKNSEYEWHNSSPYQVDNWSCASRLSLIFYLGHDCTRYLLEQISLNLLASNGHAFWWLIEAYDSYRNNGWKLWLKTVQMIWNKVCWPNICKAKVSLSMSSVVIKYSKN